ncbi:HupE/UreJ family protein [Algoriphagus lutimaris]|uniref:HupE/UreJ family protein n=1 Tax=Algoriphagus lutimaris TaxID=613197 RepID=UPI003743166C
MFGLLHGFGFAGALQDIGLPQNEIPLTLTTFNVGAELGQIFFVLVVLQIIRFTQFILPSKSWTEKLVPYAISSKAVFWLIERITGF